MRIMHINVDFYFSALKFFFRLAMNCWFCGRSIGYATTQSTRSESIFISRNFYTLQTNKFHLSDKQKKKIISEPTPTALRLVCKQKILLANTSHIVRNVYAPRLCTRILTNNNNIIKINQITCTKLLRNKKQTRTT